MKIFVDVGEAQVEALDALAKARKRSRASIVREAIDAYLGRRCDKVREEAFGLWGDHKVDGLDYQRKIRGAG